MEKQKIRHWLPLKQLAVFIGILIGILMAGIALLNEKNNLLENGKQMNQQTLNHMDDTMRVFDYFGQQMQGDMYLKQLLREYKNSSSSWNKEILRGYLNDQRCQQLYVSSILFIMEDGTVITNVGSSVEGDYILNSIWYKKYSNMEHTRYYSPLTDAAGNTQGDEKSYILVAYPYEDDMISGDILFQYSFSVFDRSMEEYEKDGTGVIVLGRDKEALYRNMQAQSYTDMEQEVQELLKDRDVPYQRTEKIRGGFAVIGCTRRGDWRLITTVTYGKIISHALPAVCLSEGLFLVIYVCLILLLYRERLCRSMEYALLATQINPHFIYKTLNTIAFLCKKERNKEAILATRSLEGILKDKLRIDEISIWDTVEQEMDVIRQYINIQQLYYCFPIVLEEDIPAELMESRMPKNIILPLVENALYHGILQKENEDGECPGGLIVISIRQEGREFILHVKDDGVGMTQEELEKVFGKKYRRNWAERGKHIGVRNIRQRLNQIPGVRYHLSAQSSSSEGGTDICLVMTRKEEGDL